MSHEGTVFGMLGRSASNTQDVVQVINHASNNIEKYSVQFFHCSAVRNVPTETDTGKRPKPVGAMVL